MVVIPVPEIDEFEPALPDVESPVAAAPPAPTVIV